MTNRENERMTKLGRCFGVLALAMAAVTGAAAEGPSLQEQIEKQKTENEALKAKIAKIEQVLKTDVCSNPEAARLLEKGDASDTAPQAASGGAK